MSTTSITPFILQISTHCRICKLGEKDLHDIMLIYLNAHYEHGLINTARLLIDIGAEVDYRAGDRKTSLYGRGIGNTPTVALSYKAAVRD